MKKEIKEKVNNTGKKTITKVKNTKIIDEFKNFIQRGNVLDLAVGVIIGSSFQNLVTSLTDNLISPILGSFTEVDFNAYTLKIGSLNLKYGAFLTDIINFFIMAFIIFLIVKFMNTLLKKEEPSKEEIKIKSEETIILEEIRDLLKDREKK